MLPIADEAIRGRIRPMACPRPDGPPELPARAHALDYLPRGFRVLAWRPAMRFKVEIEQEADGRWIAEVLDLLIHLALERFEEDHRHAY